MVIILIALSLAMDAFAVSVSNGLCYANMDKRYMLLSSLAFGVAQAAMPIIGYIAGRSFATFVSSFSFYIAFFMLAVIGGNMIYEGVKDLKSASKSCPKLYGAKIMLVQALATSIDALAVGISFAMLEINIVTASVEIGLITFAVCLLGVFFSKKLGGHLKEKSVIAGGVVLCLIGLKILLEGILG